MVLSYNKKLKFNARSLRNNTTDAENLLWSRLRRRQLCDIQFYRQKPIGNFIVDFYAPKALLVIEVDGGQHYEEIHVQQDQMRDAYLKNQNLKVLRFNNLEVSQSLDSVIEVIKIPLLANARRPLFQT